MGNYIMGKEIRNKSLDEILGLGWPCYWFDGKRCRFIDVPFSTESDCYRTNILGAPVCCPHGVKGSEALNRHLKSGRKWCKL